MATVERYSSEMRTHIRFHPGDIVSSVADSGAGPWSVEARDPEKLRAALGDVLLLPFAELFVWTDRLTTIGHLIHLNSQHVPDKSVAQARNLATLVAYAVGVMFEASHAIVKLRRAGIAGLIPQSIEWRELDALRKRWRDLAPLKDLRNNIAFHASEEKIRDGLDRYIARRRRLILVNGDGKLNMHSRHNLGPELLMAGLRYTRRDLRKALAQIAADHAALGDLAQTVFLQALAAKGLMRP
jgi:hypothetical protein